MEYVKLIGAGTLANADSDTALREFDTHGLMARIRPLDEDIRIAYGIDNSVGYNLRVGETLEFVGCLKFYGKAALEYLLFDRA